MCVIFIQRPFSPSDSEHRSEATFRTASPGLTLTPGTLPLCRQLFSERVMDGPVFRIRWWCSLNGLLPVGLVRLCEGGVSLDPACHWDPPLASVLSYWVQVDRGAIMFWGMSWNSGY